MPALEPFRGHVVVADHAHRLVTPPLDALTAEERERGRRDPESFLGVLPPRGDEEVDLQACRARLDWLLAAGRFTPTTGPALAVLRIRDGVHEATGVVGDVVAAAFEDGTIRPHERTRAAAVDALRRHLEVVGAVSSPVCVAHRPDPRVADLLADLTRDAPVVDVGDAAGRARLWLVDEPERREALRAAVAATDDWLVADGHHRAAAAAPVGKVLCLVTADDQLAVEPFHRRVRVETPERAGSTLRDHGLTVDVLDGPAGPRGPGEVVVAGGDRWWRVRLPDPGPGPVEALDAVRASRTVLPPLLGRPVADDGAPPEDLVEAVAPTTPPRDIPLPGTVAVLLHPPALDEVRRVVASGHTMPPKTTYVVPKQRSGLLVVPRDDALR